MAERRGKPILWWAVAQGVSLLGTWVHAVASAWFILGRSGSGTALGLAFALQFLPLLVLGPFGGAVVDRFSRRKSLLVSQVAFACLSLTLGILAATSALELWTVFVTLPLMGLLDVVDLPARDAFAGELVADEHLVKVTAVGPVLADAARALGPLAGGLLMTSFGPGWCFIGNAFSYLPLIVFLVLVRPVNQTGRRAAATDVRTATGLIAGDRTLLVPLIMVFLFGGFAYKFMVTLPVLAAESFGGGPLTLSAFLGALAIGSAAAGPLVARSVEPTQEVMARFALAAGCGLMLVVLSRSLVTASAALTVTGAACTAFLAVGNATLQRATPAAVRGRILAFWSIGLLGTAPLTAPVLGWAGEHLGPRWPLGIGGVAVLAAGTVGLCIRAQRKVSTS